MADIFQSAIHAYINGKIKEAEQICTAILKRQPDAHPAIHLLALVQKRRGKHKQSIRTFNKAIHLAPSSHIYRNNLGEVYRELGDLSKAIECYKHAIGINSEYAEAYCNQGAALLSMEKYIEAEKQLLHAIKINPMLANAHYNLGVLYTSIYSNNQAKAAYEQTLAIEPHNVEALVNLAGIEQDEHNLEQALTYNLRAIKTDPTSLNAHLSLSGLYFNRGSYELATEYYIKATKIEPTCFDAWLGLGHSYNSKLLFLDAITSLKQALVINADSTEAMAAFAQATWGYYGKDDAIHLLKSYLDTRSEDSQLHLQLAKIFLEEKNWREAETEARLCLAYDPDNASAYNIISQIKGTKTRQSDLDDMLALFNLNKLDTSHKAMLAFSIARIQDSIGEYDSAYNYLEQACRLQLHSYGNPTTDVGYIQRQLNELKSLFTQDFIESHRSIGFVDATPIFIVGSPRSGKTLTETLLHKYTNSIPAGESVLFYEIVRTTLEKEKCAKYPTGVKSLNVEKYKQIGNDYINQLAKQFNSDASIINTLPGNMPLVGLIYLTLPNAKVIWVDRDNMDNCFEIYRKQFGRGREYSYELKTCGEYALLTNQTMQYWEQLLPGFIYKLRFEDLIADPGNQLKSLSEFCSLELHLEQLNDKSFDDIIPKLDEVIGIWKPYESHLAPLRNALKI